MRRYFPRTVTAAGYVPESANSVKKPLAWARRRGRCAGIASTTGNVQQSDGGNRTQSHWDATVDLCGGGAEWEWERERARARGARRHARCQSPVEWSDRADRAAEPGGSLALRDGGEGGARTLDLGIMSAAL